MTNSLVSPLNSLRKQLAVTGVAAVSLLALTAILIRDVVVGAEERIVAEARQQCTTAANELAEQYRARLAFREDDFETLPMEAQDISLQALTATVLRAYDGVWGGFAAAPGGAPLGVATASSGARASVLDEIERELVGRLTATTQPSAAHDVDDGADIVVGASAAVEGSAGIAWAVKRIPGANDSAPAQRRWLAGGLALSAVLGLGALISISLELRRGIDGLNQGLARLESDLSYRLPRLKGDLGEVAASINQMADSRDTLERHLREQERLVALGRVVGGVAHEIRNPLNSMRLTLELLERRVRQNRADEGQVKAAMAEVDRLDGILNRLLAFGKPGATERRLQPLAPLVEEAARMAEEIAKRKGVCVEVDSAGAGEVEAHADGAQIEQVLLNLLLNAIEAAPQDSKVDVKLSRNSSAARIEIADQGPGVEQETREKIFEPYFTTKETGNGLGLSVSRELARRHGGDLAFESRPGRTVFTLTLPLK